MDGRAFLDLLSRIVGEEAAARLAVHFGDLEAAVLPGGVTGVEALAVHACVAEEACRSWLGAQFASARPSRDAEAFGAVLDAALARLPLHRAYDGLVFFGVSAKRPRALARGYGRAGEAVLRGPAFASLKPEAAHAANVLFVVRSRSARLVWHVSECAGTDEVLFPCHRQFRVEAVEERPGKAAILLREDLEPAPFRITARERAALDGFFAADMGSLSTQAIEGMRSPGEA